VVSDLICEASGRLTWATNSPEAFFATNPAVDSLFLFTARPFDQDTQLQNNLNRWYDARVGRWLSEDPIGFTAGDGNLYRYVGNRSCDTTDSQGKRSNPIDEIYQLVDTAHDIVSFPDKVIQTITGVYGPGAGPATIRGLTLPINDPNLVAKKVSQKQFAIDIGSFQIVSATHGVAVLSVQIALTRTFSGIDWIVPDAVLARYTKVEGPLTLDELRQQKVYEAPDITIERVCQLDASLEVSIDGRGTSVSNRWHIYELTIYVGLFVVPLYIPREYPGLAFCPNIQQTGLKPYEVRLEARREKICCHV